MVLARYFSKTQLGIWSIFLAIMTIYELSKNGLLKSAHVRYVSTSNDEKDKRKIAWSSLLINTLLAMLLILSIIVFSEKLSGWLNTGEELSALLMMFIPGICIMVFYSHYEAVQQSYLDFKSLFYGNFVRQSSFCIPLLFSIMAKIDLSLDTVLVYYTVSILLGTITLFIVGRKYLSFKIEPSIFWIKEIIRYGKYILGSSILSNLYSNIDQLMTSKLLNPIAVSYYSTATRISGIIGIPINSAAEVLFPKLAQASTDKDSNKVKFFLEKAIAILLCLIMPTTVFIVIFSKLIVQIVAGSTYLEASLILQIYAIRMTIGIFQHQSANTLISIGKSKLHFLLNSLGFLLKIVITYFCLKYYGFYGAAIASLIMPTLNFVIWFFVMKNQIDISLKNIYSYMINFYRVLFLKLKSLFFKKPTIKTY
jgi:O-antigen/teichoic acid export membrane protein